MTTPITNEQGKPTSPPAPTTYGFHPLANLFPRMTKEEFNALVADIRTNGLRQPIVLYQRMILDGRHRYDAAREAKIEPTEKDFTEFTGNDPLKFVISQNLHRRHLNESQRAVIAAQIANLQNGANQHNKGSSIDLPTAAKMVNVGDASVKRAKDVLQKAAPELVAQVRDGTLRVGAFNAKVLKMPHHEQAKALKDEQAKRKAGAEKKKADKNKGKGKSIDDWIRELIQMLKVIEPITERVSKAAVLVQRLEDENLIDKRTKAAA